MRCYLFFVLVLCCYENYAQKSDFEHIDFNRADSIARLHTNASLQNLPLLVHQLTHNLNTQVEQFRAIHTWVCLNIESDHYFSVATLKKRRKLIHDQEGFSKWNRKVQSKVFKRLLRNKKTICSGYAYILKALVNLAGIECETIDGYGRNTENNVGSVDFPNHSWNVVKLNGKWYFADTTQASGYYNIDEYTFVKDYNDGFFLADPRLFVKNHYPINNNWLLLDGSQPSLKDFVNAPIIYGSTYKYEVIPKTPKALVTRINTGEVIIFQFDVLNSSYLEDIKLVTDSNVRALKINKRSHSNGILELQCIFDKTGVYDVHAKVGNAIITSYTVKVFNAKTK